MNARIDTQFFWSTEAAGREGLTSADTVATLSGLLDAAPGGEADAPPAAGPAQLPARAAPDRRTDDEAAARTDDGRRRHHGPRPATIVDMDPDGAIVSVRRAADGLVLGVLIETPRDGAGMCFQPVRSPRIIRELIDDGIVG